MFCDCGKPLDRYQGKSDWVKTHQDRKISGYHISKLFSSRTSLRDMVDKYIDAEGDQFKMQRFHNAELGEEYTTSGSQIVDEDLTSCHRDYVMPEGSKEPCIAGIDVGSVMNVVIAKPLGERRFRLMALKEIREEKELYWLLRKYNVKFGVIDAKPEMRMSKRVCVTMRGFARCDYNSSLKETFDRKNMIIGINRTLALDNVKESLQSERIELPRNAETIPNFYPQMKAAQRIYDEKRNEFVWHEGSKADHYHHAFAYMLIADILRTKYGR